MGEIEYFDTWSAVKRSECTFNFFIGMRGVGKTYSALKGQRNDFFDGQCGKMIYMRTTNTEVEISASDEENPYKRLNYDCGFDVKFDLTDGKRKAYNIYDDDVMIGCARSLASFHNLRGVDFYDYTHIYYDEFLPTENVVKTPVIKKSGFLFFHAYETINRNRELQGEEPVKVIFTANAFTLDSDILRRFRLVKIIQKMQETGQRKYTDKKRSIYIEFAQSDSFTEAKQETVLYRAVGLDNDMVKSALMNQFTDYSLTMTAILPIAEYKPLVNVGNMTILEHKYDGSLYCVNKLLTAKEKYSLTEVSVFRRRWFTALKIAIFERKITFDNSDTYYQLLSLLDK